MKQFSNYSEYEKYFHSRLVNLVRELLSETEERKHYNFDSSYLHQQMIRYFNENRLHKKITMEEFEMLKAKK